MRVRYKLSCHHAEGTLERVRRANNGTPLASRHVRVGQSSPLRECWCVRTRLTSSTPEVGAKNIVRRREGANRNPHLILGGVGDKRRYKIHVKLVGDGRISKLARVDDFSED